MAIDYGTDAMCVDDMDLLDRTVSGPMVLAQDLYHSLTNARGRIIGAPDVGTNVKSYLSLGMTADEIRTAAVRVQAECEDDERVATARGEVTFEGERLDLRIWCTPIDGEPFDFIVEDFNGAARLLLGAING